MGPPLPLEGIKILHRCSIFNQDREKELSMAKRALLAGVLGAMVCFGQINPTFYPTGAHVNLYFPHLADGGPDYQQWQTSLEFVNPNATLTANVELRLYGDDGIPLNLDFGSGALSLHTFTIPPGGRITLRSTIASAILVTGQAIATSDVPIQGTVLFRRIAYSIASIELSAPATLPTSRYLSLATRDMGIALANISGAIKNFQIAAVDSSGNTVATTAVQVPGFGHKSFNLWEKLPALAADFSGSVVITPQDSGDQVVAWALNVERNLDSTLPSGPLEWPISHPDRIQLVFKRLLAAAPSVPGSNLSLTTAPSLVMSPASEVNAFANSNQTVQINLALSELVSDSPSELAFLVAHELAHIAQYRSGRTTLLLPNVIANREPDADLIAMILVLNAGFDPYGAAGAIGKLSVANGSSGLVSPYFDSDTATFVSTAHMNSLPGVITQACGYVTSSYCTSYKTTIHPHFPGSAPL
jgi:Peptidase family M48